MEIKDHKTLSSIFTHGKLGKGGNVEAKSAGSKDHYKPEHDPVHQAKAKAAAERFRAANRKAIKEHEQFHWNKGK